MYVSGRYPIKLSIYVCVPFTHALLGSSLSGNVSACHSQARVCASLKVQSFTDDLAVIVLL